MATTETGSWRALPGELVELPGALLYYEAGFLTDTAELFETLLRDARWRQDRIRLYGREHPVPRLSAWYGDAGAEYSYSGLQLTPLPWLAPLQALRRRLQAHLGRHFNSVLLNYYRDGRDSMGLHADDEPELGARPVIVSISLGAVRRLVFRHRGGTAPAFRLDLADGSLLVMGGQCQANWRHELPRTRRPVGGRINLTYRRVEPVRQSRPGL